MEKREGKKGEKDKRTRKNERNRRKNEKRREIGNAGVKDESLERRMEDLVGKVEKKEREERRHIVIRKIEVREGKRREVVEMILRRIGVKLVVEEVRRLREYIERGTEMVWIRLCNEEQKRKIMLKKKELRGRKEKILEDLTWEERKIKWKLKEIEREKER